MDCISHLFCHEGWTEGISSNVLFLLCEFDKPQMNTYLISTIIHHTLAEASTPSVLHYAQEIKSDEFHEYDWGEHVINS